MDFATILAVIRFLNELRNGLTPEVKAELAKIIGALENIARTTASPVDDFLVRMLRDYVLD